ncbi:MAG TPA: WG repeat-containing protein [Bacteroidia bacterium]|nr:WG repeat-containing protein [Bacteroidia bacterium]
MNRLTLVLCFLLNLPVVIHAQELRSFYKNNKWGYTDKSGNAVIPAEYEEAEKFKEGLARVKLDKKYGFINEKGKAIIPIKYDFAWEFSEGLARVKLNDKQGFLDTKGKVIIPIKYEDARDFADGLAPVYLNGKCGYIDKTGNVVYPFKYDYSARWFSNTGITKVRLNGKWGYIDKTEKEIIPFKYDDMDDFHEGLAKVKLNDKWGFIDSSDTAIIPIQYDQAGYFADGIASVELHGNVGFIDKTGKLMIDWMNYDDVADEFSEGLAAVRKGNSSDGKYGYIDKLGYLVVPVQYDKARPFSQGKAEVKRFGRNFSIDYYGKEVDGNYKASSIGYQPEMNPFEVVKQVRNGSARDLLAYTQKYGANYTSASKDGVVEYTANGALAVGPETIVDSPKDGVVVTFKFRDSDHRRIYMDKLKDEGFEGIELSQVSARVRKDGVDIWFIIGQFSKHTWVISKTSP